MGALRLGGIAWFERQGKRRRRGVASSGIKMAVLRPRRRRGGRALRPFLQGKVLNFLPAANKWCTYGATAAVTRVAPRLKKPFDSSPWVVPSL